MNQDGKFFSGFERGYYKWSDDIGGARHLDCEGQLATIKRHEPLMEIIHEYI